MKTRCVTGLLTVMGVAAAHIAVGHPVTVPPPMPASVYGRGTEAAMPANCPARSGVLMFYVATDSRRLYWCVSGTNGIRWRLISDAPKPVPPPPPVPPPVPVPGPAKVGTLVNGVCQAAGTGFSVVAGQMRSNEAQANCVLPLPLPLPPLPVPPAP